MSDVISARHAAPPHLSLRERKKRLTQAAIEDAALRLFQQHGYEQTSIQDIADAVVMSPRTFFRYFASKEEVLFAPMQAVFSEGVQALRGVAPTASPFAALMVMLMEVANHYQEQKASFLTRYQVAMQSPPLASLYLFALLNMEPTIGEALVSHLKTAANRHEIRFLVAVGIAAFRLALTVWLEQDATLDLTSVLRDHLDRLASLRSGGDER